MRIADVAGVDLRWLLTGELSAAAVPADHPAVQRILSLLAAHPEATEPLAAFVDLLAATFEWPAKESPTEPAAEQAQVGAAQTARAAPAGGKAEFRRPAGQPKEDWIPILGRSAAGVPQFWADEDEAAGVTQMAQLVERHARRAARQVQSAVASDQAGRGEQTAQIITLTAPDADNVAEFVVAGTLKRKYPDAFAVRIDGDSMAPDIRHGDVTVCSPSVPAADGLPAVVQLEGQIGVTCKLFRREGETVHLVPVNEQYAPQAFGAERVQWAQRVLARVRAAGGHGR